MEADSQSINYQCLETQLLRILCLKGLTFFMPALCTYMNYHAMHVLEIRDYQLMAESSISVQELKYVTDINNQVNLIIRL